MVLLHRAASSRYVQYEEDVFGVVDCVFSDRTSVMSGVCWDSIPVVE